MHFSGFRHIENLEEYTELKALWLDSNGILEIGGLSHLSKLRCVFLQQNALTRISGLDGLSSLQTLNLSGNTISHIEGLSCLPALLTLNLSKNALSSANALRHLSECAKLANIDLSVNELDADDENTVINVLASVPSLVNLALKGNPVCRTTKHYRKTVVAALTRLTYLDERPVFAPERAAINAWAIGGLDAERAARVAHEKSLRDAQTDTVEKFAVWSAGVRAKRAAELEALNADRASRGEEPVTELPSKAFVSYTTASSKYVTEATILKNMTERAEKAYAKGGSGMLFENTDDVAVTDAAAVSGSTTSGSRWTADGLVDKSGAIIELDATEMSATTEKKEEAAESAIMEDVYRRERELAEVERRVRLVAEEAALAGLHAGIGGASPSAASGVVLESIRLYNEREAAVAVQPMAVIDGGDLTPEEDDEDDEITSRLALESERRAIKLADWAQTGSTFAKNLSRHTDGVVEETKENIPQAPAVAPLQPTASAGAAPTTLESALDALEKSLPSDQVPLWFPVLDAALVNLASQAAFDFEKVSRGLQNALLRGHFALQALQPVDILAMLLTESACRVRYARLISQSTTNSPAAASTTKTTHATVAEEQLGGGETSSTTTTASISQPSRGGSATTRMNLEQWRVRNHSQAARAAAARVMSQNSSFSGTAIPSIPHDEIDTAVVPSASMPVKPISSLLQGPDFALENFRDYVTAPVLPSLSQEGLWAPSDDDDGSVPLDRETLLSRFNGRAVVVTNVEVND
jgi:dynein assembly factor 1